MKNKKYTTVLFDADNTLFDFNLAEKTALARVLGELGLEATKEMTALYSEINLSYWRMHERNEITREELRTRRFQDFFERIGFACPVELSVVAEKYLSFLGEGAFLLPGAMQVCETLKREGYQLYIITNGITLTQKNRLKKSGLDRLFDGVFISEDIGVQKPFAPFFEYVFKNIPEKDRTRILVVGDSYGSDIKGAANVGLDCVWLNSKGEENALSLPVNKEISTISELLFFLNF